MFEAVVGRGERPDGGETDKEDIIRDLKTGIGESEDVGWLEGGKGEDQREKGRAKEKVEGALDTRGRWLDGNIVGGTRGAD